MLARPCLVAPEVVQREPDRSTLARRGRARVPDPPFASGPHRPPPRGRPRARTSSIEGGKRSARHDYGHGRVRPRRSGRHSLEGCLGHRRRSLQGANEGERRGAWRSPPLAGLSPTRHSTRCNRPRRGPEGTALRGHGRQGPPLPGLLTRVGALLLSSTTGQEGRRRASSASSSASGRERPSS